MRIVKKMWKQWDFANYQLYALVCLTEQDISIVNCGYYKWAIMKYLISLVNMHLFQSERNDTCIEEFVREW